MEPTLTYIVEPAKGGTKFTRRIQIKIFGWMKIMSPKMVMVTRKRSQRFLENLKRVLEENPPVM